MRSILGEISLTFTMKNWGTATTPAYFRVGLPFKKGDVPTGNTLNIVQNNTVVAAQFDARTTYEDGSLKFCVASCRDDQNVTTFNPGESRQYTIQTAPGEFDNTGTLSLFNLTHQLAVKFTNVQYYDGTASKTLGSGSFTANLNTILNSTQAGQSTRLTKIHSGAVCETFYAWGMATDDATGAEYIHLKNCVEVTLWKQANGSVFDTEWGAMITPDWWGGVSAPFNTPKYRLDYNAITTVDGNIALNYGHVYQPYKSWWMTCAIAGNNNDCRRPWVSGNIPTLQYIPTTAYWVSTKLIPPLNVNGPAIKFGKNPYSAPYVPCAAINVNADIANTGGSNGRGPIMDSDCWYLLSGRPGDLASMRRSAASGWSVPYHLRSNRMRTRPGSNASTTVYGGDSGVSDIGNCPISLNMQPLANAPYPSGYDFTAYGMPVPVDAYEGSSNALYNDGYVKPLGGLAWGPNAGQSWATDDPESAHGGNYCYAIYLLEGEHFNLEAQIDLATNTVQQQNGNVYGGRPQLLYYNQKNYQQTFNIPATQWGGVGPMVVPENTRGTGWGLTIYASAAAVTPDANYYKPFLVAEAKHNTAYIVASMGAPGQQQLFSYLPNSQVEVGWYLGGGGNTGFMSPWMNQFIVMGGYTQWNLLEDPNALVLTDQWIANSTINLWSSAIYRTAYERFVVTPSAQPWSAGTIEYFDGPDFEVFDWCYGISSATDTLTGVAPTGTEFGIRGMSPSNGDVLYVTEFLPNSHPQTVPPELALGTPYYAINVTGQDVGSTLQLTSVKGDPAHIITFGANYAGLYFGGLSSNMSAYTQEGANGSWSSGPDQYPAIARAAAVLACNSGNPNMTPELVGVAEQFLSLVDQKLQTNTGPSQSFTWYWSLLSTGVGNGPHNGRLGDDGRPL